MGQANSTTVNQDGSSELKMPRGVYVVPEDLTIVNGKPIRGSLPKRWDDDIPPKKVKILFSGTPGSFSSFAVDNDTVAHFSREGKNKAGVMLASSPGKFCKRAVVKTIVVMGIITVIAVVASRRNQ